VDSKNGYALLCRSTHIVNDWLNRSAATARRKDFFCVLFDILDIPIDEIAEIVEFVEFRNSYWGEL